jgi:diguanylate cyclase (GGDEF)-like protein
MPTVVKSGIKNPNAEFDFSISSENAVNLCAGCAHVSQDDALTGLASRKSLIELLNLTLSETPQGTDRPGLILIDLDRFKKINDSFGPSICDLVLRSVAQRLRSLARAALLTARFSGDGFAIVVRDANDAWPLAERSLEVLKRSHAVGGQVIDLSVSIGVNAGENLQRLAGGKVQHGRKQGGPRYRWPSCLSRFIPEERRPFAVRTWPDGSGACFGRA